MTLYRQLFLFTFFLFFLLFAGTWVAKLESTRSFLVDQLESHAQDTATSLGLSISQHMAAGDLPAAESMINAVFDRGYYRIVRLSDTEGKVLVERILDVQIENVPSWFIRLIPLRTPEATAKVIAGWSQAGSVYVKSHPGYAYKTLWETVTRTSLWFVLMGVVVIIAGGLGLRLLLKPLTLVERQADALCRKKYEIQDRLPRTKELRRMVEAMNRMTYKVKEMFEEQVATAERLRKHAYLDQLTGLGNRRYFETQISGSLEGDDRTSLGILILIQLHNLQQLNQEKGFQAGDALIAKVGSQLKKTADRFERSALARLTGGDFGLYLPDASPWDAEPIAEELAMGMGRLAAEQLALSDNIGHVGAITFDVPTSFGQLLSEADSALRAAQQAGPNKWVVRAITAQTRETPRGQQQWKNTLEQVLAERKIVLYSQPTVNSKNQDEVMHLEILSRLLNEKGELISAGIFMPFAEGLGFSAALDSIVIESSAALDRGRLGVDTVAINVSATSLQEETFRENVRVLLRGLPGEAPRLIFEFTEFNAVQHLDLVREFSAMVRGLGHGIGLDHYGQSFSNLGYLQSLRPDYVKIDRAYTTELRDGESDSRFFIGSLCSVAHSLDIDVIAEGVENEQQWEMLTELKIDAVQGYYIDKPKPVAGEKQTS